MPMLIFELENRHGWQGNVIINDVVYNIGPVDDRYDCLGQMGLIAHNHGFNNNQILSALNRMLNQQEAELSNCRFDPE